METGSRVDLEFADHPLAGIDLFQPTHDFLGIRFNRHRCGEQGVAAGSRARQLVGHQVVHALELGVQLLAQRGGMDALVQLRTQHRQRRFQTMRQVGQRVALAIQVFALAFNERIDAVGQRLQLARMAFGHAAGLATLHPRQL